MIDLEKIELDKLIEGTMYEVRIDDERTKFSFWLPYRGKAPNGRLIFADGPNGLWVEPDKDLITAYYDHNF